MILGPAGMGITGMLTTSTGLVNSLTNCGLHTSAVRSIAKATNSDDKKQVGIVISTLRKLILITGLLGTIITFFGAPYLSKFAFDSYEYTLSFRFISVILFLDQLTLGNTALMQGTFHYKYLSLSSLVGSVIGLLISVPMFYIWEVKAIVPVIIVTSLMHYLLTWWYARKIDIPKVKLTKDLFKQEAKIMLALGLALAGTGLLGNIQPYFLRTFISNIGSLEDVGIYTAGISIATQYINVILQSMGTDYSPRLAAISENREEFIEVVNRQTKLMLTIVTPLVIPFIVFIRQLTILLYSEKFIAVSDMIEWMMVGMFFRTASWCLSYSIVARGKSAKFFWNETANVIIMFFMTIAGYKYFSFTGMGVAFCLGYVIYTIQMLILAKRDFQYKMSADVKKVSFTLLLLLVITVIGLKVTSYTLARYIFGTIMTILVGFVAYHYLNEMIPVKQSIKNFASRFKKRK